jgi:hypothetical protein
MIAPFGPCTNEARRAFARLNPAARILKAEITVDLPALFGPTSMLNPRMLSVKSSNALKLWK